MSDEQYYGCLDGKLNNPFLPDEWDVEKKDPIYCQTSSIVATAVQCAGFRNTSEIPADASELLSIFENSFQVQKKSNLNFFGGNSIVHNIL